MDGLTLKTERQSTRSYSVEKSLWKMLWICRDRLRHDDDDDDDTTPHHYFKLRFLHRNVHNQLTLLCRVFISFSPSKNDVLHTLVG